MDKNIATTQPSNALSVIDLDKQASTGITLLAKEYANITTLDEAVDTLNSLAVGGRETWARQALIIHKVLCEKTRSERSKLITDLEGKMRYKKSQIYVFQAAGKKLLENDLKNIPLTLAEFMKPEAKQSPNSHIVVMMSIGEYKTNNINYTIFRGLRFNKDGKDTAVHFSLNKELVEQYKIELETRIDIKSVGKGVGEDLKFETVYTIGEKKELIDGKEQITPIFIDLKFLPL